MTLIIKINQTYIHKQTLIGNKAKMHQPLYYLKIPTNFKPEKKKKKNLQKNNTKNSTQ